MRRCVLAGLFRHAASFMFSSHALPSPSPSLDGGACFGFLCALALHCLVSLCSFLAVFVLPLFCFTSQAAEEPRMAAYKAMTAVIPETTFSRRVGMWFRSPDDLSAFRTRFTNQLALFSFMCHAFFITDRSPSKVMLDAAPTIWPPLLSLSHASMFPSVNQCLCCSCCCSPCQVVFGRDTGNVYLWELRPSTYSQGRFLTRGEEPFSFRLTPNLQVSIADATLVCLLFSHSFFVSLLSSVSFVCCSGGPCFSPSELYHAAGH